MINIIKGGFFSYKISKCIIVRKPQTGKSMSNFTNFYAISVAGPQAGIPPGSGFGITIPGFFAGMNANFGFNESPHTFDLDIVQDNFGGSLDSLPDIGDSVKMYVGPDFFSVAGRVTHVEYSDGMRGTTISLGLQDRRIDLNKVAIYLRITMA